MVEMGVGNERDVDINGCRARIARRIGGGHTVIEEEGAALVADDEAERTHLARPAEELKLHFARE